MKLLDIYEPGQTPSPHEGTIAVGIDLGTTNSLVAISDGTKPQVIEGEEGAALVPSIVAYRKNGEIIVGRKAASMHDAEVIRSVKRLMGKSKEDIRQIAGADKFNFADDAALKLSINKRKISPVEISAEILKELKRNAETALAKNITKAVITVPAYFDDAARNATKAAANIAGLEVLRLINEPTAAALAYGLDKGVQGFYVVYDLGGGTFDASLLRMEKGIFQVIATAGDNELGGDDFDAEIASYFIKEFEKDNGKTNVNNQNLNQILVAAKKAKEYLTNEKSARFEVEIAGKKFVSFLSLETFNELIKKHSERTIEILKFLVEESKVPKDHIKGVVMVGGSTRVPLIYNEVKKFFGIAPLTDVDPDKVVALGAAIQAEALTKGSENLLLDVTPLSLGLEVMGGMVEKVIHRNSPIPVSKFQEFTTYEDGQPAMKIHVLQGEREMVKDCRSLAKFTLSGIPPMKAGIARIKVIFNIDADGILTVSAVEQTTGTAQTVTVKPSYGISDDEVEKMLRDSMENAKEDIMERLLVEARVEADLAIRTVEDALKLDGDILTKEERKPIDEKVALLKKLMAETDREAIDFEVHELNKVAGLFAEKRMNKAISEAIAGKEISKVEENLL